ncbi:MAG: hypothetical protein NC222_06430 [Staphylococcus sp.]|nr:hypothetical protein [Staphylococcus sp.]
MSEYKKPLTKEFSLGEHKVILRTLSSKELEDIEKEITFKLANFSTSAVYQIKKVDILTKSLVSVDGISLKHFENIQAEMSTSENADINKLIRKEIESWDSTTTDILYGYFNLLMEEKGKQFKKELDFLNAQN